MANKDNIEELISAIKKGDPNAFKVIHERHYSKLNAFINSFTKNSTQTEDILQETFLKLWNSRQKLDSIGSIGGFLYRTAYHSYIDKYRKETRERKMLDSWKYKRLMETIDEDDETTSNRIKKLRLTIDSLPKKCKEVFILCKYENFSHAEIAEQLNISRKTVQAHMNKAYTLIKERFNDTRFLNLFLCFPKVFLSKKK